MTWYKSPDFKYQQVAMSLDELRAATRQRLVQNAFNACGMECLPGAMHEALNACRAEGVDLNSVVFQSTQTDWWQLLPYVMGRGTDKSRIAMRTLLDDETLSVEQQCCWTDRMERQPSPVVMPLLHLLVRSADLKDTINPAVRDEASDTYTDLLNRMVRRGVNLNAQDSNGNSVLHVAMTVTSPGWTPWWVEQFLRAGTDPDLKNHRGQTLVELGQERLQTLALAPSPKMSEASQQAYAQMVVTLEQGALHRLAKTVESHNDLPAPARDRARL